MPPIPGRTKDGPHAMPRHYFILQDDRGRWVFSGTEVDENLGGYYRSYSEAYDQLRNHLRAEGMNVGKLEPYEHGFRVETGPIAAPTASPMLYSASAIKLTEELKEKFGRTLKQSALAFAKDDGRGLVTSEDVWEIVERLGITIFDEES